MRSRRATYFAKDARAVVCGLALVHWLSGCSSDSEASPSSGSADNSDGGAGLPSSSASDAGGGNSDAAASGGASDSGSSSSKDGGLSNNGDGGISGNPPGGWQNVSGALAGLSSMCGSSGTIVAMPNEDKLVAGVATHGIYSSTDGGITWNFVGPSTGINFSPSQFLVDPDQPSHFWEVGNHALPGAFYTGNAGATFDAIGDGTFPGLDNISVDFSDPDRKVQLAGPHENDRSLFLSTNSGATWTQAGQGLPGGAFCTAPLVVDAATYLVGCNNGEIYRTTNSAATWTKVSSAGSNRAPLRARSGIIYFAGQQGVVHSGDGGVTWQTMPGSESVIVVPPIELSNGDVAIVTQSGILVTKDDGGHWTRATNAVPFQPWTFTYSTQRKAFYAAWGSCDASNKVPDNVVMTFAYDAG
jgi:hypothetical protein